MLDRVFDYLESKPRGAIYQVCVRKDRSTPEEREQRNGRYKEDLADALRRFNELFREDSCPKEKLDSFTVLGHLYDRALGAVFLVKHHKFIGRYALRVRFKRSFISQSSKDRAVYEKKLQYALRNDFVIKALFAFQDVGKIYTVLEFGKYGSLSRFMDGTFSERMIKLIAAQIVLAVEYLHACNVIHRDLRPEHIYVCADGYLKIGDFGFAKKFNRNTYSCLGNHPYMAPEVIDCRGHGTGVDWWSFGVILFKFLYRRHPFEYPGWTRKQILEGITTAEIYFPESVNMESPACRFVKGLLEKNVLRRLGELLDGIDDIKQHEWFDDVSFLDVLEKRIVFKVKLEAVEAEPSPEHDHYLEKLDGRLRADGFEDF